MSRYLIGRVGQALLCFGGPTASPLHPRICCPATPCRSCSVRPAWKPTRCRWKDLAKARAYYGLDKGLFEQYIDLLLGALRGDFGQSLSLNRPVAELLAERLPQTLSLAGLAIVLSLLGGIGLAYLTAYIRWQPLKKHWRACRPWAFRCRCSGWVCC